MRPLFVTSSERKAWIILGAMIVWLLAAAAWMILDTEAKQYWFILLPTLLLGFGIAIYSLWWHRASSSAVEKGNTTPT